MYLIYSHAGKYRVDEPHILLVKVLIKSRIIHRPQRASMNIRIVHVTAIGMYEDMVGVGSQIDGAALNV
jgi:hypothetical protein